MQFPVKCLAEINRFQGNPVAIVEVQNHCQLSQDEKQKIAEEFNFSETVFLHDNGKRMFE